MSSASILARCAIIVFFAIQAHAQTTIQGVIRNAADSTPVAGALVRIQFTDIGAYTNKDGRFTLKKASAGIQRLKVSMLGFKTFEADINLNNESLLFYLEAKPVVANQVVVSATKRAQAIQDVPISISVLDSKALEERSITRIDDALRYVPGVNITRDQINIRGSSGFALGLGSRVAVALDGFPMLSGDNSDIKFDMLPTLDIERIEVIKGSGSALYGSGALGGVVGLFTRQPKQTPTFTMRNYAGLYSAATFPSWKTFDFAPETWGTDASYSQSFGNVGVTASVGHKYDRSHRLYDDSQRWNAFLKTDVLLSTYSRLSGFLLLANEKRGNFLFWQSLDSATRPPSTANLNERRISSKNFGGLEFRTMTDSSSFLVGRTSLFSTSFNEVNKNPGEAAVQSDATAWYSELQISQTLSRSNFLSAGMTFTYNDVESPSNGNSSQTLTSLYTQIENTSFENVVITAGARLDYEKTQGIDQFNAEFSPKMGISFNPSDMFRFRASLGRGFRAPAVAERFVEIRNPFPVDPNPLLTPEISWSYEVGGTLYGAVANKPIQVDLSVFSNSFSGFIEPTLNGGTIIFNNVANARIIGAELSVQTMLFAFLGLESSLTTLYSRNLDAATALKFRSPVLWYTKIFVPIGPIEFQSDYRFIARMERIRDDNESDITGLIPDAEARVPMHVLDARIIWDLTKSQTAPIKLSFNVKNALNYYYVEIMGNIAPFRSFVFQAEYSLQ